MMNGFFRRISRAHRIQFAAEKNDLAAFGLGSDFVERLPKLFSGACVERLSKPDLINFRYAISPGPGFRNSNVAESSPISVL